MMLMANLFYLHLPVANLPKDLRTLLPIGAPDGQLHLLRQKLRLEAVVLATAAFIFSLCGLFLLIMVLQWSKGPQIIGGTQPATNLTSLEQRLSRQARRYQEAEQKAKFEFVKANLPLEVTVHPSCSFHVTAIICFTIISIR